MTTAWTRGIAFGLLAWPLAGCEVRVTDDLDGVGGVAGSFSGGNGGTAGSSAGQGGGGGGGVSGSAGGGGVGGTAPFPTPTCDAEAEDAGDACVQCLKQACCTQWVGCDDQTCSDEWQDITACVVEYEVPDQEDFGMCISENTASDSMLPEPNTIELLNCINVVVPTDAGLDTTRCGNECFGSDIFFFND